MSKKMTLESAPLTPMVKNKLCDIIHNSFNSKRTLYNAAAEAKKEQVLEQYKIAVGYDKLLDAHEQAKLNVDLANKKLQDAINKINMKGLTVCGDQYSPIFYGVTTPEQRATKKACDKVKQLLNAVNTQDLETAKDKFLVSLLCANTTKEGATLMAEVLGSGEPLVNITAQIEHKDK